MSYKIRSLTILFGSVLALSGCGSPDSDVSASSTSEAAETVETLEATDQAFDAAAPNVGSGVTAASVDVDGVTFHISCVAISPSNLSNPMGQVSYLGDDVSIRALAGVNSDNAIALEVKGGACTTGDQPLSDWSLATAQSLESETAQQIACDSGLKVDGC
jgi:hypothetical protein